MRKALSLICAAIMGAATSACSDGSAVAEALAETRPTAYVAPPVEPGSTWAAKILPDGQIPERGFLAAYFDRSSTSPYFHITEVDSVAVKYAWDELHGIKSENFAAYWVGQVHYEEAGTRIIAVNQSRAQSRIFVNGEQVYPLDPEAIRRDTSDDTLDEVGRAIIAEPRPATTGRDGEVAFYFEAGTHLIEVEFINQWHTTEYKVAIGPGDEPRLSDQVLRARLGALEGEEIVYVSLYESDNQDTSVDVSIPRFKEPVVVWLDSYEGIDWTLDAPGGVSAVVLASFSPGSRLLNAGDTPVLRANSAIGIRTVSGTGDCACYSGYFRCEQSQGGDRLEELLAEKTGGTLVGFAGEYSASSVSVARFGPADRAQAKLSLAQIEEARAACEAETNPDFDTMLDRTSE